MRRRKPFIAKPIVKTTTRASGKRQFYSATSLYHSPCAVVRPTTEAEIAQIIQSAARQGLPVRAIGPIHYLALPTHGVIAFAIASRYVKARKNLELPGIDWLGVFSIVFLASLTYALSEGTACWSSFAGID